MRSIGSRELKAHLGQVLKEVHDRGESYLVTHRGRPIARLLPESEGETESGDFEEIWSEMDRLAAEIGREWPEGVSAADVTAEDRREL